MILMRISLLLAVAVLVLCMTVTAARRALGDEMILCLEKPSDKTRWVYRIVDERRCWFRAAPGIRRGKNVPLDRLEWANHDSPRHVDPPSIFDDAWKAMGLQPGAR